MTNHATNGRAREYRVRDRMVEAGWRCVMRSAGSKGSADLLMGHLEYGAALVQVGTGSKRLGPADRIRFVDDADLCGALAILAVCRQGVPLRFWRVTYAKPAAWDAWSP
jgi:hypothetical protein